MNNAHKHMFRILGILLILVQTISSCSSDSSGGGGDITPEVSSSSKQASSNSTLTSSSGTEADNSSSSLETDNYPSSSSSDEISPLSSSSECVLAYCNTPSSSSIATSSSSNVVPSSSSQQQSSSSSLCGDRAPNAWEFCYENEFYDLCPDEYNPNTHSCCNNIKYALSSYFCGDSYGVLEKCNEEEYNPVAKFCYEGSEIKDKCGGSAYNPVTQFCSGAVTYSKCGGEEYNLLNQRCQNDVIETKCGTGNNYHNPATQFCNGNNVLDFCEGTTYNPGMLGCCNNEKYTLSSHFCGGTSYGVLEKCGGSAYAPATQFCSDNSVISKCGGSEYDPSTQMCHYGRVKSFIIDARDNKKYPYVKIGTQTWMAENLNFNAPNSRCYDNYSSNCNTYGRLYNWVTAMNIDTSYSSKLYTVSARHTGICPEGWHIPSDPEWTMLMKNAGFEEIGKDGTVGKDLKATSGWNNCSTSGSSYSCLDSYGFAALPGGRGFSSGGYFDAVGYYGYWWSTSERDADFIYVCHMNYSVEYAFWYHNPKAYLYSVRCVMD